jgi:YbbR domain-containing protein
MLRALLRRWFLENAALKMVALVLAVTLFILVRGEKETERAVKVGVAYLKPSDRQLMTEVPDSVDVWVRGPWTRIKRLDPGDVDPVVVDLTKVADGDVVLDERSIRLPPGLRVVSVRPSKITVQFEYQKRVPVLPELAGLVADGYVVQRIVPDPASATVRGPKTFVDGLVDLRTMPVSVAGKRRPFRQHVDLAPLPKGASADVDSVDIEVQIEEEVAQKTLTGLPIQLQPPIGVRSSIAPQSYELLPAQVEVLLRGGRNAIKQVDDRRVTAMVELHIEDLTPGRTRTAPVLVRGIPQGVAVEVHPSEISLSLRPPGAGRMEPRP